MRYRKNEHSKAVHLNSLFVTPCNHNYCIIEIKYYITQYDTDK